MKLASLKNGTRDGRLVIVSRDLTRCTDASFLVPTLQAALDNWARISPHLETLAESLEHGAVPAERFHEHDALSPLPRVFQLADGLAVIAPRGALPDEGGFVQPGIAAIVDDVAAGADAASAGGAVRLLMLACSVSAAAGARGYCAFSPVAVTPDELTEASALPIQFEVRGKPLDFVPARLGPATFAAGISGAAAGHPLGAGAVIVEWLGQAAQVGGTGSVRIDMKDSGGHSIFGAIEHKAATA